MSEKPYLEELVELFEQPANDMSPDENRVMEWPFIPTTQDCAIAFWLSGLAKALDERFVHQGKAFRIAPRRDEQKNPYLILCCYRPAPKATISANQILAAAV